MGSPVSTRLTERRVIRVRGVVQGVGFRPFVHRVATSLALSGTVRNDTSGVLIDVAGDSSSIDELQRRLTAEPPPLARVTSIDIEWVGESLPQGLDPAFRIVASDTVSGGTVSALPPDVAVCDQCLAEMRDPADRRYRYPFVTCTECGPRFTITTSLPYDRPNTTMAGFPLCADCRAEYDDPSDRRFHAQPLACPVCGPHVALVRDDGPRLRGDDALRATQRLLRDGAIVAVKGIGGYHLMCDATNATAVATLRERKRRGTKPLAVLVAEPAVVSTLAHVGPAELEVLRSPQRPIVLLRRTGASPDPWPEHVAPGSSDIGVMLPCSPVQHLLLDGLGTNVLVCTSGNIADEPITIDDTDAIERLTGMADAWLVNDRPIHTPCDDSVVRVHHGEVVPLRRARGYAPLPIDIGDPGAGPTTVLAMGGDLKGAVCVAHGSRAWMSQHLGDHGRLATYRAARQAAQQLVDLVQARPDVVAVDAHPGYLSARLGRELADTWGVPVVLVQHHHAHVAAVLAEHARTDDVIGVAFDGTGFGDDGSIWGGEVLAASTSRADRVLHLQPVPLPGGDAAIEHPARTALAHLWSAGLDWDARLPCVGAVAEADRHVLRTMFERRSLTVPTSSMGRLFDAVASLTGVRHRVDFEAQAAIELEALADAGASGTYRFPAPDGTGAIDAAPVIAAVVAEVIAGVPAAAVSMRFHRAVVSLVADAARHVRATRGLTTVALTGGVFQNLLLLDGCSEALIADGFEVLSHRHVPTNDGGLALGQARIAASGG